MCVGGGVLETGFVHAANDLKTFEGADDFGEIDGVLQLEPDAWQCGTLSVSTDNRHTQAEGTLLVIHHKQSEGTLFVITWQGTHARSVAALGQYWAGSRPQYQLH